MYTYGYGGPDDAVHKARMEAIAETLTPEQRAWYLATTLARSPRIDPALLVALAMGAMRSIYSAVPSRGIKS